MLGPSKCSKNNLESPPPRASSSSLCNGLLCHFCNSWSFLRFSANCQGHLGNEEKEHLFPGRWGEVTTILGKSVFSFGVLWSIHINI